MRRSAGRLRPPCPHWLSRRYGRGAWGASIGCGCLPSGPLKGMAREAVCQAQATPPAFLFLRSLASQGPGPIPPSSRRSAPPRPESVWLVVFLAFAPPNSSVTGKRGWGEGQKLLTEPERYETLRTGRRPPLGPRRPGCPDGS